jgi:hypothetical protein
MKNFELWNWILNLLVMSLPISWYLCYHMYKDIKKKNEIIKLQEGIIKYGK